jgi:hypothetical protein
MELGGELSSRPFIPSTTSSPLLASSRKYFLDDMDITVRQACVGLTRQTSAVFVDGSPARLLSPRARSRAYAPSIRGQPSVRR